MDDTTQKPNPQEKAGELARQPRTIRELIKSKDFEMAVAAGLPKHLSKERFIRFALNAVLRQPDLADCTKESFFLRMLELSALGIEPDGRRAHLIPFRDHKRCHLCGHEKERHQGSICRVPGCSRKDCSNVPSLLEVTLIIDYKGLAELVRRSGDVSYMHADAVYAKDEFDFKYGTDAFLVHRPNIKDPDRGTLLAFYSFVKLRDGNEDFIVMSRQEVERIRTFSKNAEGANSPWVKHFVEMAKKTAFRRHSKWLPLSPDLRDAVETDDDASIDIDGAFELSAANVERLESQMIEQADEAKQDESKQDESKQETKQEGTTGESLMDAIRANPAGGSIGGSIRNGRWKDRESMLADFRKLKDILGDIVYYSISSAAGIGSEDDLSLADMATPKAYDELLTASKKVNPGPPEEPDFRPKNRR